MVARTTIGPKGRVTIPKEFREKYHLLEGEDVLIVESAEGVLIKRRPRSLRGRLKGKISIHGFEEEIIWLRKNWRPFGE